MGYEPPPIGMNREEAEKVYAAIKGAHPALNMTIDLTSELQGQALWHIAVVPPAFGGGPDNYALHQLAEEAVGRTLPDSVALLRHIPRPVSRDVGRFVDRFTGTDTSGPGHNHR